ncbi:MAG: V-type ATP synthase subunit D [Acidilobaceae archaeon]
MAIDPKRVLPTKINLIKLRREERMLKRIRNIIEEKREVLLHYIKSYAEEYNRYQKEVYEKIYDVFNEYYLGLASEGIERIEAYTGNVSDILQVTVTSRILFAVKVPVFTLDKSTLPPIPLPLDAYPSIVSSFMRLRDLIPLILKLAEYEETLKRLIMELKDTQRLINALDYVILPSYAEAVKYIKNILDQRLREDFIRLKLIKKKLEARAEATVV